jgi:hypothetical protein
MRKQKRQLTTGEREAIAGALYKLANERQEEADAILAGAGFFKDKDEPEEETNAKLERLAGVIVARYRSLQKSARSYGNLGDFFTNPKHKVTVDCIVVIPEQF